MRLRQRFDFAIRDRYAQRERWTVPARLGHSRLLKPFHLCP